MRSAVLKKDFPPPTHSSIHCSCHCSSLPPSQATLELPEYAKRMAALYGGVFVLLGGPIAAQTFDPADQASPLY